jgi:hypothetical protein
MIRDDAGLLQCTVDAGNLSPTISSSYAISAERRSGRWRNVHGMTGVAV